jgi:hypothetical protein
VKTKPRSDLKDLQILSLQRRLAALEETLNALEEIVIEGFKIVGVEIKVDRSDENLDS